MARADVGFGAEKLNGLAEGADAEAAGAGVGAGAAAGMGAGAAGTGAVAAGFEKKLGMAALGASAAGAAAGVFENRTVLSERVVLVDGPGEGAPNGLSDAPAVGPATFFSLASFSFSTSPRSLPRSTSSLRLFSSSPTAR